MAQFETKVSQSGNNIDIEVTDGVSTMHGMTDQLVVDKCKAQGIDILRELEDAMKKALETDNLPKNKDYA